MSSLPSATARPGVIRSLVGQKAVMAVTGVILFLFVVGHLLGNLKIFEGPEAFNAYAEGLRTVGAPFFGRGWLLWIARVVLIVAVLAHIWAAIETTRASWRARPVGYRRLDAVETTYAARAMRWGGVLIALYVIYHLLDLTFGRVNPSFVPGDVYHNVVASLRVWPVAAAYSAAMVVLGLHLYHGTWSALQTLGLNSPPTYRWRRGAAAAIAVLIAGGYISIPVAVLAGCCGDHGAALPHPRRTARGEMGTAPLGDQARQPGEQAEASHHRGRLRAGGRRRGRVARRARLPGVLLLFPGFCAAGALDRGARWYQRRQELPERRRLGLPAVLRHDQGRRLPRPRGQRVPPRGSQRQHHRPVRGPGRAVRARVRGAARKPLLWGRPGFAHLLRARPDRPAAVAGRLPSAVAADRQRRRADAPTGRDARPRGDRGPGPRHRRARPGHRGGERARGRCGSACDGRLLERVLPVDQREGLQRHRHLARLQAWCHVREPLFHPDPPHLHPGERTTPVQADIDERVAPQRRAHLGAEEEGRYATAGPDSGRGAGLLSRAAVPELRQPRAPGRGVPACQGSVRRGSRCRPGGPWRVFGFPRRHRASRPSGDRRAVRQPVRDVPAHYGGGPVPGADADLPRPALHHGWAVGGLQPDDEHRRPVRHRGGQLLRSRREPAGSERADARARRRLLHPAVHDRRLPRPGEARQGRRPASGVPPGSG